VASQPPFPFFPPDTGFWQEPDFLLSDLISMLVNRSGVQLGITLMVRGMVVSGVLVSEREYLEELSKYFQDQAKEAIKELLAAAPQKDVRKMLKEAEEAWDFTYLTEDVYRDSEEKDDEAKEAEEGDEADFDTAPDFSEIRHLHLKDVEIVFPSPGIEFFQSRLPTWRVRLAAIDGWLVGRSVAQMPFPSSDEPDD
jgi:hypothetical protein